WHKGPGRATHFTDLEGTYLVGAVTVLQEWGEPVTTRDFLNIAKYYAIELGKNKTFLNGQPTLEWYYSFMSRHPELKTAKPLPLELPRAKITTAIVDRWFNMMNKIMTSNNLVDKPSQIFNCDEVGFADKTDTKKVVVPNPIKFPYKKQGGICENVIIRCCFNLFIPQTAATPKPILLILDGHKSHQSVRTVELAIENDILLLCIPPHSTHVLQPLDVTFFKPIKQKYREILSEYYRTSRYKNVTKDIFPTLLKKLFNSSAVRKVNIIKGFMNTGIYPLDRTSINSAKILKCNNKIEKDIAKHPNTSIDSSDDDDEEEDNMPIALRLTTDAPLDLSFPMKSSIEITYSKAIPSSPTRAIRRALCSIRPSATEQPPAKKIVLEREAGQLLTDEQVLQQLKEKEERVLKAKRVTTRTLKRPTGKNKQNKILTTIHDLTRINTLSTTSTMTPTTAALIPTTASTSSMVYSTLPTVPISSTYTPSLTIAQSSLNTTNLPTTSFDPWNNVS
ncbi:unnamed protein product, partial [Didymodactylos carnosus]